MTLTLENLATVLETSEDPATGLLKTVLLRDTPPNASELGILTLQSAAEVAHFVAFAAVLALETNGKDALKALKSAYSGVELTSQYVAYGDSNPLQSLKTAKTGELTLDPTHNLPIFELDGVKVAPLLRNAGKAFAAVAKLDLAQLVKSNAFRDAFEGRVSHPTKLSSPAGSGGILKVGNIRLPDDFPCVTEEDFLTRETVTLACSAGFQKMWSLLLPLFSFEGQVYRLAALLAEKADVATAVTEVLVANGVVQAPALVTALCEAVVSKLSGEPQVFCGDLPNVERISVLAPYGLFNEISRAKSVLKKEFEAERVVDAEVVQVAIEKLEEQVKILVDSGDAVEMSKAEKKQAQDAKIWFVYQIRVFMARKKRLLSTWLHIPCFTLMFGGANPRNMAMDLDTTLHTANVQVRVPAPQRVVSALSGKAFVPGALIVVPALRAETEVPRFLRADATGSVLNKARRDFFAGLICRAMAPLKQMQEEWQTRSKELIGGVSLSASAQSALDLANGPWALFIKGDEALNNKEAMLVMAPLVLATAQAVRDSLQKAFGQNMPSTFDAELSELSADAIAIERA